ncbi:tRNA pseudouridine(13) synthase TruD [Persephonella sp.]
MELGRHIKEKPSDFVVEEVLDLDLKTDGGFQVFLLEKNSLSTLQVVRFLSGFLKIKPSEVGFAGLKDKVALTRQYISLPSETKIPESLCFRYYGGRWIKTDSLKIDSYAGFCLKKVGYTDRKIELGDNRGNRFRIKIRNVPKTVRERFYNNLKSVEIYGCPNYFGEQRFGSVKGSNDFIFRYLLKGDTEKALKVYFSIKGSVKNWGKWELLYRELKGKLEQYERDVILGLKRGLSFEKAVRILPKNIRLMFNFAFQSYLWNEYLRRYIEEKYPFKQVKFINNWKLSYYTEVNDIDSLKFLNIPYTGKDYRVDDPLLKRIIKQVLEENKISKSDFGKEVAGIKVLTDGMRNAVFFPQELKIIKKDRNSITVSFFLPAGSYATVFLRRLLL